MEKETIRQTVESLLSALGAPVEAIHMPEGTRLVVAINSSQGKDLIGPSGEVLQAINTLARRLVEARHDGEEAPNFLVDINSYHESKLEELRNNARLLAARARLFKHEVELPPMSSYERLVIHELFADDPEIETLSQGEGKFRHIVLKYKQPTIGD